MTNKSRGFFYVIQNGSMAVDLRNSQAMLTSP